MKKLLSLVLCAAAAIALMPAAVFAESPAGTGMVHSQELNCPAAAFSDVDTGQWYHSALDYVINRGIMNGTSSTTFEPDTHLTRGMIVQILYNLEGRPAAYSGAGFRDVASGAWYRNAVNWAASENIVGGYSRTEFGPEDPVTREQMAAVINRYAQYKGYNVSAGGSLSGFRDAYMISGWAESNMRWAVGAGLINGLGDGTIQPQGTATRAQVAQIFRNFNKSFESVSLYNFTADETDQAADQQNAIVFAVSAYGSNIGSVSLRNGDGTVVGSMHDDGNGGDETAGDGVYTYRLSAEHAAGTVEYYAAAGSVRSSRLTVRYYDQPDAADAEKSGDIQEHVQNINAGYADSSGFVPQSRADDALNAVAVYARTLENSGDAVYSEKSENGILVKLQTGLSVYYSPEIQGVDSIGPDVSMTVITCQPCLNMDSYKGMDSVMGLPDIAASRIGSAFPNYTFSNADNYDNEEVSLSRIRSFKSNEIVLWHGHGGYTETCHSLLMTGDSFSKSSWWLSGTYWQDCVQNRIIESANGRAMISSKYIDRYCRDLHNSMFYLAACYSGKDNVLAGAFLGRGASAVVGNTDEIYTVYNLRMEADTAGNMAGINPSTGNCYTLGEALSAAKNKYGANDAVSFRGSNPKPGAAEPVIFGGINAENYRLADKNSGTVTPPDEPHENPGQSGIPADVSVGDYVNFGHYEQDNDTADGQESIEWKVLDKQNGKVLLLSRYLLDCGRYNEEDEPITWETCSLRRWLNSSFYNAAFTDSEKAAVASTRIVNDPNPEYPEVDAGNDTTDRVFLLSVNELLKYMPDRYERRAMATDYARERGVSVQNSGNSSWWLRSPGYNSKFAACVGQSGPVFDFLLRDWGIGLRPAVWVRISS